MFSLRVLVFGLLIFGTGFFVAHTAHAKTNDQLFLCENDSRTWTLYESAQPRMFQQEITMQGPGTFTVFIQANGFDFEGFSYTKRTTWDKWQYVMKTNKGKRNWQQSWRVLEDEQGLRMLQLNKDNTACRGCTVTMKITSSNCRRTRKHVTLN